MLAVLLSVFLAASVSKDPNVQLRYEVSFLQAELAQAKARMESQEAIIQSLRLEMETHLQTNKDLVKGTLSSSENKVSSIEKASKDLAQDLITLKEGTGSALKELDTHLAKLEKEIEGQGKNLKHLESALKAVLDALGGDKGDVVALAGDKTYIVKDGDSLGKIAHTHGTNVKTIKELNNLTKDTIRVGQKIYVP